jgi:hypothetical protein
MSRKRSRLPSWAPCLIVVTACIATIGLLIVGACCPGLPASVSFSVGAVIWQTFRASLSA